MDTILFLVKSGQRRAWAFVALTVFLGLVSSFHGVEAVPQTEPSSPKRLVQIDWRAEPIKPIPQSVKVDPRKVALGKRLFHDPRLSADNTVSCASCHDLAKGGTDQRIRSLGINGAEGLVNAPTVFNSGFNFKQFWDGRADSLEHQIRGPIEAPNEMGATWQIVLERIARVPDYLTAFKQLYQDGVKQKNVEDAVAEFERSLVTPNSKFDRYVRGEESALSASEKEGYRSFKALGCASCHQGVNAGGNLFQRLGTVEDYFSARGNLTQADLGRFNVTGRESDKYVFKVPSLRNVALTAPYFHDGLVPTLPQAVEKMALHQLGRSLSTNEIRNIVDFLNALTGEYDDKPL